MSDDVMLLTVREAAELLRISRNLAYELVARGEIPSIRLGRIIRVPRTALAQWLATESAERPVTGRAPQPGQVLRASLPSARPGGVPQQEIEREHMY